MSFPSPYLEPDDTDGEPDAHGDASGDDDEGVAGAEGAPTRERLHDAQLQLDSRHGQETELFQDGLAARVGLLHLLDASVPRKSSVLMAICESIRVRESLKLL